MAKCSSCSPAGNIFFCTINASGLHHSFDDKPAVMYNSGEVHWRFNGELHRVKGPAIDSRAGFSVWFHCGLRHRLDGPSTIFPGSRKDEWHFLDREAIPIDDNQEIIIGKSIEMNNNIGTVLKHIEGLFYEVLLGNKKVLVAKV